MRTEDSSGRVSYTVKELLARMEGKIDGTNDRLGRIEHAIANTATASALAAAVARVAVLEQQVVRREGPIMDDFHRLQRGQDALAANALTKDKISEALKEEADRLVKAAQEDNAEAVTKTHLRLGFAGILVSIILSVASILAAHPAILFAALFL